MKKLLGEALNTFSPRSSGHHPTTPTKDTNAHRESGLTTLFSGLVSSIQPFQLFDKSDTPSQSFCKTLLDVKYLEQLPSRSTHKLRTLEEILQLTPNVQQTLHKNREIEEIPILGMEEFNKLLFGYNNLNSFEYPLSRTENYQREQNSGEEWQPGLLSLSSYHGIKDIKVLSIIEEIIETLFNKAYFGSILSFLNIKTIDKSSCSLSDTEVLRIITGEKGLIDLLVTGNRYVLLLLYYFLSEEYDGAPEIWKYLALSPDSEIRAICKSLATIYLSPNIDYDIPQNNNNNNINNNNKLARSNSDINNSPRTNRLGKSFSSNQSNLLHNLPNNKSLSNDQLLSLLPETSLPTQLLDYKDDFILYYAFTLLNRLMEWKGWRKNNVNIPINKNSKDEETLHHCIDSYYNLYSSPIHPLLYIPPEVSENEGEDFNVLSAQICLFQQTQLLNELLSKLEHSFSSMESSDGVIENEYQKVVTKYEISDNNEPKQSSDLSSPSDHHRSHHHRRHHHKSGRDSKSRKKKANGDGDWNMFLGDMGYGKEWSGIAHVDISKSQNLLKSDYALLQKNDGNFTILNKAAGKGYIGFSVAHQPKIILDTQGNLGVGYYNPKSKLHVEGDVQSDSSFLVTSTENLTILRGGFSCIKLEFKSGGGFFVDSLEDSLFEVHFTDPFSKLPSVIAVLHVPQTPPSLIPISYVDNTKFSFYETSGKYEVWVEFFVFGPKEVA